MTEAMMSEGQSNPHTRHLESRVATLEELQGALERALLAQDERLERGHQAEAQVAALLESTDLALISVSPEFRILSWNKGAERLFGYTREEAAGQTPAELLALDSSEAQTEFCDIEHFRRSRQTQHLSKTLRRKDGGQLRASLIASGIYDITGRLTGVSLVVRDTTEQRRREAELARMAAIVESSDDAITSVSTDGRIMSWNRSAEKLLGITAQEAIGQPLEMTVPDDLRELIRHNLGEDFAALRERPDFARRMEVSLPRRDGTTVDAWLVASGIFDDTGHLLGMSQIYRDISEHKRAQREQALLASLVKSSDDGIVSVTEDAQISSWNAAAERLFGFTAEEAVGRGLVDLLVPPELRQSAQSGVQREFAASAAGRPLTVHHPEVPGLRKDGSTVEVSVSVSGIYDTGGRLLGASAIVHDIGERKRAEQEQALLAAIVTSTDDAVISLGLDGRITSWNRGAEALTGYTAAEAIGQSALIYQPPQGREHAEQEIRRQMEMAAQHRLLERLEAQIQRKDQSLRDVSIVASGIYDPNGALLGLSGILRDVTEQRRAERDLATLAAIVSASHDAVISISLDNRILTFNKGAEDLFGIPREEATGTELLQFVSADDAGRAQEALEAVLRERRNESLQLVSRRRDGAMFETWLSLFPILDRNGTISAVGAIGRDVTDVVRLERQHALLAGIVNASEDAIISFSKELKITFLNPAAERIYGYSAREAIGRGFDLFVPPEEIETALEADRQLFASGRAVSFEQHARRKDGSWFTSLVNVFPIRDSTGNIIAGAGIGRDITHLKQVERELREAHQYTRGLIESSIDAMVVVDGQMIITDGNEQLARLTELPRQSLLGSPFDAYFADRGAAQQAIKKTFVDGYVSNVDLLLRSASGREIPVSFNASLFYREGKVVGLFGVARDVTQQRAIERTLREEREYSHGLVQSSPDALLVCNSELILKDANEQAIALTGYAHEELLGIELPSLFVEPALARDLVDKAWTTGRLQDAELELLTKTAKVVPVSLNLSAFTSGDAAPSRQVIASLRDISERRLAEKQRSLLAAIVDSSGNAIYSEGPDLTVTSWNPAAEKLFGYASAEIVGRSAAVLAPLDRRAELAEYARKVRAESKAQSFETKRLRRDGRIIDVALTRSPIFDATGAVTGLSVTAHDIGDRKRMEAELEQARDAALAAAQTKSEFLANMSHEIRTPLNSIIGLTGLLLDTPLTAEQREFARDVRASGDVLLNLINNILDFSKMAAGKLVFEESDFDITKAVEGAVELVIDQARHKGLELTVAIDPEVPRFLRGDPGRLHQILLNLLSNAIKFTQHGEVGVSVSKLSENPRETTLRFDVRDTGIGIAKDKQPRLFEAFTQADPSTTRHYGGTGLGLSIVRQLVEGMHGTISVASEPGQGSTFWFTVTLAKQVDASRPAYERFSRVAGANILIVDDNANSRKILERQVSLWGMNTRAASSAEEGLALLRAAAGVNAYQVALIDVMMPEKDGIEMARRIKGDPELAKTAVIFVSSVGSQAEFTARLVGMQIGGWLMKPVPQSSLYDALVKAMVSSPEDGAPATEPAADRTPLQAARFELPSGIKSRVLLAEDSPINQKVAKLQLEKLGLEVDSVADGKEALEAAARRRYDVIFMDCQMPELDGYEATRELRRREGAGPHSTIIAMTAHALPGDREKCLDAGMNAYLSKPVTQEALQRMLAELFPAPSPAVAAEPAPLPELPAPGGQPEALTPKGQSAAAPAAMNNDPAADEANDTPTAAGNGDDVCDRATLEDLRQEGGGLLRELIELFELEVKQELDELAQALTAGDCGKAAAAAHNLKGNAGTFGAKHMQELAAAINQAARAGQTGQCRAKLTEFRAECERVRAYLAAQAEVPDVHG